MAATLGLTAAEALNLGCCKRLSVFDSNGSYLKPLEMTGLPSVLEMACKEAVAITKQIALLKPEWYIRPRSSRLQAIAKKSSNSDITGVSPRNKNTLVAALYDLQVKYISDFEPYHRDLILKKEAIRDHYNGLIN